MSDRPIKTGATIMSEQLTSTPVIMSIASHDPSGSAGITADIETLASLGCHCTPIISKLAARDSAGLKDSQVTETSLLIEQVRAVLEDITVNLICIGDLASIGNIEAMHTIVNDYPDIPVVLHPSLSDDARDYGLDSAVRTLLLPQADILVLNRDEALALAPGADNLSACARELLESGCGNVLITCAGGSGAQIDNHWFSQRGSVQQYHWQRLPYSYRGAGDTLCAALSAYLGHGLSMAQCIQQAQQFTWQSLQKGRRIGMGKLLPDRMHWCRQ